MWLALKLKSLPASIRVVWKLVMGEANTGTGYGIALLGLSHHGDTQINELFALIAKKMSF